MPQIRERIKVSELIEELSKMPIDAWVEFDTKDYVYELIDKVEYEQGIVRIELSEI